MTAKTDKAAELSVAAHGQIGDASRGSARRKHQKPCGQELGIVPGLSDCNGASTTIVFVHEHIPIFALTR